MPEIKPITTTGIKSVPTVNGNKVSQVTASKSAISKPINNNKSLIQSSKKKQSHKSAFTCSLLVIVFIIFTITITAYLLAKTGLVKVPYFSRFYEVPSPVRVVSAMPLSWERFQDGLTKKVASQGTATVNGEYSFLVTEDELTGLLQTTASQGLRSDVYQINRSQIAITPEELELFFNITWGRAGNLDFLIKAKPVIRDGGVLEFESIDAQIGDLPLPSFIIMQLAGFIFSRDLGSWDVRVNESTGIKEILLFDQQMRVKLGSV
ncbi:hypothetical protein KKG46_02195 [Patescibacteria group bacterium]|nr:hypothetical protein [Patescibacteria group bacterium]